MCFIIVGACQIVDHIMGRRSCSDDKSSDSDSSSSSSSDESKDEGSIVEGTQILIEEVAKSKIKTQQASQHNITHNAPTSRMIGRVTPYHTSIDVSEQVFTQESEIVPTNLFGNRFGNNQQHKRGGEIESSTPPTDNAKIKGEDDKDESSSSTSDTSSSSDSSSDSDSEFSNSSRNRKEGKGEAEDVIKPASIAPVPCSILPVVWPSRGRRRTPHVSTSRKIIINTTTGVPETIIIIILNNIQNYLLSIHYTLSSPWGWMLARSVYPPMNTYTHERSQNLCH
jgi:hypothetical protein